MRIEYHPVLERELIEVREYYNTQSFGLGDDFINEFERQIFLIAAMPERWMLVRDNLRRSLMKRFPYVILFRVINKEILRITVLKHERRHPAYGTYRK